MSGDFTLSYSEHAVARMLDRGIFKKQVRRTLRRPHRTFIRAPHCVAEYTTTSQVVIRVVYRFIPGEAAPAVVSAIRLGKLNDAYQRSELGTRLDKELDIAYVALLQGKMAETVEVRGGIFCDLSSHGEIMGVEMFDYSRYDNVEESLKGIFAGMAMNLA